MTNLEMKDMQMENNVELGADRYCKSDVNKDDIRDSGILSW